MIKNGSKKLKQSFWNKSMKKKEHLKLCLEWKKQMNKWN